MSHWKKIATICLLTILTSGCGEDTSVDNDSCVGNKILNSTTNQCVCDAAKHWVEDGDACKCEDGYQANATNTECEPTSTQCTVTGQIYSSQDGKCVCDAAKHWVANGENACKCDSTNHWSQKDNNCECEKGYELSGNQCKAKTCNSHEKYDLDSDQCLCDSENHWTGTAGSCTCEENYILVENACECTGVMFQNKCTTRGSIIKLGQYYINNAVAKSSVEWRVLDANKESGVLLLISDKVLAVNKFSTTPYESSNIPGWLNSDSDFITFTNEEKSLMHIDPAFGTNLFLLSKAMVETYFASDKDRKANYTQYLRTSTEETTPFCNSDENAAKWWLSTGKDISYYQNYIGCNGEIMEAFATTTVLGIRPAVYIQVTP